MRLARGATVGGRRDGARRAAGPFVKPVGLGRARCVDGEAVSVQDDPSNASPGLRPESRGRLVVHARQGAGPAAARLRRRPPRLREDAACLDALAQDRFESISTQRKDALVVEASTLAALPASLAARVAHLALLAAGCDPRRISSRQVSAVVALASAAPGSSLDLPGRIGASRRSGLLEFRRSRGNSDQRDRAQTRVEALAGRRGRHREGGGYRPSPSWTAPSCFARTSCGGSDAGRGARADPVDRPRGNRPRQASEGFRSGADVLVVGDILDGGRTLLALKRTSRAGPLAFALRFSSTSPRGAGPLIAVTSASGPRPLDRGVRSGCGRSLPEPPYVSFVE
jgi:hypothetical protein